jgi:hypothetical protein
MNIAADDLYEDESVIASKNANSVIAIRDYGLKRLGMKFHGVRVPADHLMSLAGFKGQEAIGGRLHLTNYRLIFKSHPINRVKGKFSICLPTIEGTRDISRFLAKKLEVVTAGQNFVFVVWGIPNFINAIQSAMASLTPERNQRMLQSISSDPHRLGGGLQVFGLMDRVMEDIPEIAGDLTDLLTDPMSLSNILNLLELWQKVKSNETAS